jgi:toxin-antitoxin system PIN domain toxin
MPASGTNLVDANVWLALAVDAHIHHAAALTWFDGQAEGSCALCRLTQLALLRHLTNVKIMGAANVQTQEQAWRAYEALATDPRVIYLDEPPRITTVFKSLTQIPQPAQKRWSDAFLAAFAISLGVEVVTFDADFTSFSGLSVRRLAG